MSHLELYSPEGLRLDGRRSNELRRFTCKIRTQPAADGSSYVEMGQTKAICSLSGPHNPKNNARGNEKNMVVRVSVTIAPFASNDRNAGGASSSPRNQEIEMNVESLLSEAILTHLMPRTEISIHLYILSQDGSLVSALVNSATLALVDAGIPLKDYPVACSAALYNETALLDANAEEESDLAHLTVGLVGEADKVSMLLLERKIPTERLSPLVASAMEGCHTIRRILDDTVKSAASSTLTKLVK